MMMIYGPCPSNNMKSVDSTLGPQWVSYQGGQPSVLQVREDVDEGLVGVVLVGHRQAQQVLQLAHPDRQGAWGHRDTYIYTHGV